MNKTYLSKLVALGLCFLCGCTVVEQVQSPYEESPFIKSPFVKRSDVLFTQPLWQELKTDRYGHYGDYRTDTVMWGFVPTNFPGFNMSNFEEDMAGYIDGLLNHDAAGVDWVSRVEWDVVWDGMTAMYPDSYTQAFARRPDGSPLPIEWFPGQYFFSTHSPIFQQYLRRQIEQMAFYGGAGPGLVDALLFDSQQATPAHYYRGGDFSDDCMANFNRWLSDHYTTAELSFMGIKDIASFHYGDYLIELGWTSVSYEALSDSERDAVVLSDVFRIFLQQWNDSYLEGLVQFADRVAQQKGYPYKEGVGYIEVGTSSPILDPYWHGIRLVYSDEFDFYSQEFNHRANSHAPSSDVMLMYKLGEAIGKPLALTAQPFPDWDYMIDNPEAVDLVRSWIAQAYANGAVFMVPEHMWAYNDSAQRYYDPEPGDYDYIYAWITENSHLFDGYETVAEVALVYSHTAYRETDYAALDVFAAAAGLMEQNIPYKLLVAGDDWWPKYLTDSDQSSAINKYAAIVTTDFNGIDLNPAQQAVLDSVSSKVVAWPDTASIYNLLPAQIDIDVANVALFPRKNSTHPHANAPMIVHLVNRDYNTANRTINAKRNVTITVADALYGSPIVGARYSQPGEVVVDLSVFSGSGGSTVAVPELANWGVLELFTSLPVPSREELVLAE